MSTTSSSTRVYFRQGAIVATSPAIRQIAMLASASASVSPPLCPFVTIVSPEDFNSLSQLSSKSSSPTFLKKQYILRVFQDAVSNVQGPHPLLLDVCSVNSDSILPASFTIAPILWLHAQSTRAALGFSRTAFYITLSSQLQDTHNFCILPTKIHTSASLESILDSIRDFLAKPKTCPSVLQDISLVSNLLLSSPDRLHSTACTYRHVAEAHLAAIFRLPHTKESLLAAAHRVVEADPFHAPSYLRRASAFISCTDFIRARNDVWKAVLSRQLPERLIPRAAGLLARCARSLPVLRADVGILLINRDEKEVCNFSKLPEVPSVFSLQDKCLTDRHETLLSATYEQLAIRTPESTHSEEPHLRSTKFRTAVFAKSSSTLDKAVFLPSNFSHIPFTKVFAGGRPCSKDQIEALYSLGVRLFVSVTPEDPIPSVWIPSDCVHLPLSIPDNHSPTLAQADAFVAATSTLCESELAFVHCMAGRGRTGTLLATWCVVFGTSNVSPPRSCDNCRKLRSHCEWNVLFPGCCGQVDCALAPHPPAATAKDAINFTRSWRYPSVSTVQQERFVTDYERALWTRYSRLEAVASKAGGRISCAERHAVAYPRCVDREADMKPLTFEGTQVQPRWENNPGDERRAKTLLVLTGAPGSGKSTFAQALADRMRRDGILTVLNQDNLGSAAACEAGLSGALRGSGTSLIVVDRCNRTVEDRAHWRRLSTVAKGYLQAAVVFFDVAMEVCASRVAIRINHPTLLGGEGGARVSRGVSRTMEQPGRDDLKAGFQVIYKVRGSRSRDELIDQLCRRRLHTSHGHQTLDGLCQELIPQQYEISARAASLPGFQKFPRTHHLMALGAESAEDVVMGKSDSSALLSLLSTMEGSCVTLEEKVDGANIGFSVDKETGRICAQNRSHFVNSKSHTQFAPLHHFISTYEEDLRHVLQDGRRILFGEWMYAKHSIRYTRLPSMFIAFDIFDKSDQRFLSRQAFWKVMSSTSISMVPTIPTPSPPFTLSKILTTLRSLHSKFFDGQAEGVVLRLDCKDWLVDRAKVVRGDFIAGNEHWAKREPEKNCFVGNSL